MKAVYHFIMESVVVIGVLAFFANCQSGANLQPGGPLSGFDQADANHDGKLSREEASDFLVNQVFDARDANHDGKLTREEWGALNDATQTAEFKKRDANHDGVVTKDEALRYGRSHGVVVKKMMAEADKNHDGYLDKNEVQAYYASREGPPR